ncbi:acyl-CoA reductase [Salegentibacter salinarum]|uniref:Acyl-CoA reductase n=1 Tax=Salegentibacter salinarum TaxID=447422 RepID=A0A2N0TQR1_9FLAO|nr:acyl-CoA reductase [Salegentibacter salinarum]PKD17070.1 acyl-CoA reductase [Salegentibacter salinarum]SKB54489.1 Acyl-CoA reductase (LuxC) [Salegentibacter salinarum]
MTIEERKSYFIQVGKFLSLFGDTTNDSIKITAENERFFNELNDKIDQAVHYNGWFTRGNVIFSLQQWSKALTQSNLGQWLEPYKLDKTAQKTVAIIMAGNIPLVGFHDFLSVLISGHKVLVKQSSNDKQLLPVIAGFLMNIAPEFENRIRFTEDRLTDFDAVIATGSNNTARYFEYYFSGKPNIIRKNRNSAAILTGKESKEELEALGEDVFRYFGLGCRNVSKLYVPKEYDFDSFFKAMYPWNTLLNSAKYANNYDYNKAVYLMSEFKLLENGFLILKEDESFGSPIATLFYEQYEGEKELQEKLEQNKKNLQCVVGTNADVDFGQTQHPKLWDYADGVDTLKFLEKL